MTSGIDARAAVNIFTIPPGRPFLPALAQAILSGDLPRHGGAKPERLDLPAWTILMPTRRAARTLQDAFVDVAGGGALLLPAIRAIAEGDEDLGLIESAMRGPGRASEELDLPPAIGPLERVLALTQLVQAWSRSLRAAQAGDDIDETAARPFAAAGAATPAQAAQLASELARLIDMLETENVALGRLAELVPDAYANHWQKTLEFLKIITQYWPLHLAEHNQLSSADRRNRLILAEAQRLQASRPEAPVIVAGVTGSVPATAELMRAVASLDNGAIVLPGLDPHLDAAAFDGLTAEKQPHPEHPQFGLAKLLAVLGATRRDVVELPGSPLPPPLLARNRLVAEAMRPPGTMQGWRTLIENPDGTDFAAGLADVSLIEAATDDAEAEVVAMALREAAETPGLVAALVSPDRLLARRVAARLEAWGIRVDDSAGRPFAKTVPGAFLELVANASRSGFAPAHLMALLKHPLTRLGLDAGDVRRRARNLEIAAFRTTYLGRGLDGVRRALDRARADTIDGERRGRAVRLLRDSDWEAIDDLLRRLVEAFAPLQEIGAGNAATPFGRLVGAHVAVAEALARTNDAAGENGEALAADSASSELWARDEGEAASLLMARLMADETPQPEILPSEFPEMLRTLVGSETIRTRVPAHPRLYIWGPYEARLHQPDVVILGGLNEGVWPKATDPGPWFNRGMRNSLGLPSPEEEIGRAAHDLTQLLGTRRVIMTRANKSGGVPMVASRWLLRIKALLDGLGLGTALQSDVPLAAWAAARDQVERTPRIRAPQPTPALALRPRRLTVSDVETWIANPYAIFARHILKLDALSPLGAEPGPSERGQIVHETLARFTKAHPLDLPDDIATVFMAIADDVIGDLGGEAKVKAFWRPRLERFAQWFAETEAGRRAPQSARSVEIAGRLILPGPSAPFELRARADRIDVGENSLVVSDYKTGGLPNQGEVASGKAPQLALEAAMVAEGAFAGIPARMPTGLRYIRATGGEPAGEELMIEPKGVSVAEIAAAAAKSLEALVAQFDDPATPYRAMRRARFSYDYDDYAHLARVAEWAGDNEEGSS